MATLLTAGGRAVSRKKFVGVMLLAMAMMGLLPSIAFGQRRTRPTAPRESPSSSSTFVPRSHYVNPLYRHHLDDIVPGLNPRVRVLAPTRFDWEWATPPGLLALTPKDVMAGYDSTQIHYQLFLPPNYRLAGSSALILFVSASPSPDEFASWAAVCRKYDVLYASPHVAGDNTPAIKRLRIALDVLDDVRRRLNVDTDRVYVGGLSEGGRTASEVAYAFPEFIGGLVAVGGASPLRGEPWMRDRVRERLSVALVTGQMDVARAEMENYRYPVLQGLEVRSKLWTPNVGHTMPPARVLEDVYLWLEGEAASRRALGTRHPVARIPEGSYPAADAWSTGVVQEAKVRMRADATREVGLMQFEGVARRWKGSEGAREAERILADNGAGARAWQVVYARRQQDFFFREAKSMDAYLDGALPPRDQGRKAALLRVALDLWKHVLDNGADTVEGQKAKKRVDELKRLLD
jgi:pimeloyl-ACP methyl ester carboxylesterase